MTNNRGQTHVIITLMKSSPEYNMLNYIIWITCTYTKLYIHIYVRLIAIQRKKKIVLSVLSFTASESPSYIFKLFHVFNSVINMRINNNL